MPNVEYLEIARKFLDCPVIAPLEFHPLGKNILFQWRTHDFFREPVSLAARIKTLDGICDFINKSGELHDIGRLPTIKQLVTGSGDERQPNSSQQAVRSIRELLVSDKLSVPARINNNQEVLASPLLIAGYSYFISALYDRPELASRVALSLIEVAVTTSPTSRLTGEAFWWIYQLMPRLPVVLQQKLTFPEFKAGSRVVVGGTANFAVITDHTDTKLKSDATRRFFIEPRGIKIGGKDEISESARVIEGLSRFNSLLPRLGIDFEDRNIVTDRLQRSEKSIALKYDPRNWPGLALGICSTTDGLWMPTPKMLQEALAQSDKIPMLYNE